LLQKNKNRTNELQALASSILCYATTTTCFIVKCASKKLGACNLAWSVDFSIKFN